jgi:hypothetical protein
MGRNKIEIKSKRQNFTITPNAAEVLNKQPNKSRFVSDAVIEFDNRANLQSLCEYHKNGGELYDGLPVICELNYRSKLLNGTLKTWQIGSVKMDLTNLGKYSESTTTCEVNDVIENWPFTMLYVKK